METKAFDPSTCSRDANLLPGIPHNYVANQLILYSHSRLKFLPISLCSSVCTASSILRLTQLHVFSPRCGACNCFWLCLAIHKQKCIPTQRSWFIADVFIGRNDHDSIETIRNAMRNTVFCISFISVTVWTDIWEYCCPSPFIPEFFWHSFCYSIQKCNKDDFRILLAERIMTALRHAVYLPFPKRFSLFRRFLMTVQRTGTADLREVKKKTSIQGQISSVS